MALTKITPQMFDTSAAGHDFNVDNGTFVVDASANRVGIGTDTPSSLLHVDGALTATTIAGTLTTAAQTNITSLGTLTGLALTGNATITKESPAFTLTDSSSSRTLLHFVDDNNSVVRASGPLLLQSGGAVSALTLDASQNATFAGTIATGGITINGAGSTITDSSDLGIVSGGTLTVDVASEIILDTDGGIIRIRDAGGDYGMFQISNSDFIVRSMVGDKDLIFRGNDGGSVITALTLDMSEAGRAIFNEDVVAPGIYVGSRNASYDFYNNGTGYNNGAFTVDDTLTVTGGVTASRFDATTSSTTDPVLQLTDAGVADYDFTFPDTSTIQLGTNTTSTKHFKLLNAGSGAFNLDVEGSITSGSTIQGVGTATAAAFQLPWATSAIALRMAYDANYYMSIETHAQTRDLILTSSTNDSTANITFRTSGSGASNLANRMTIDHTGKVGINVDKNGSSVPQKTLHVEHTAGASEGILISGASDTVGHTAGILLRAEGGEADSALRAKGAIFFERTGLYGVGKLHLAVDNGADNDSATIAAARVTIDEKGPSVGTGGAVGTFAYNVMMNKSSGGTSGAPYSSSHSGSATVSSVSAPMDFFKTVGLINTRAYTGYVNVKTNLTADNVMFLAHFLGYNYNYGNKEMYAGGYTYTSNSILAKSNITVFGGNSSTVDSYRASDGALCFKLYMNHTGYTEGQMIFRFHSHSETTTRQVTVAAVQIRNDGTNHFA